MISSLRPEAARRPAELHRDRSRLGRGQDDEPVGDPPLLVALLEPIPVDAERDDVGLALVGLGDPAICLIIALDPRNGRALEAESGVGDHVLDVIDRAQPRHAPGDEPSFGPRKWTWSSIAPGQ